MIIRNSESEPYVLFSSPIQQYKFNHPKQCGNGYKRPFHADGFKHRVEDGDLIVLASDGLWDNLNQSQILEIV